MIQPSNPYTRDPGYAGAYECLPELGGGHIVVYDLAGGAGEWLGKLQGVRWVLMHQPGRQWIAGKGRDSSLAQARAIATGAADGAGILPKKETPPDKPLGLEKPSQPGGGGSGAPERVSTGFETVKTIHQQFPPDRVAALLQELCEATTVSIKIGVKKEKIEIIEPDWTARAKGLDLLLKYKIGTPAAQKEAPPRPPLTLEELRQKATISDEYRAALQEMLNDCAAIAAAARAKEEKTRS